MTTKSRSSVDRIIKPLCGKGRLPRSSDNCAGLNGQQELCYTEVKACRFPPLDQQKHGRIIRTGAIRKDISLGICIQDESSGSSRIFTGTQVGKVGLAKAEATLHSPSDREVQAQPQDGLTHPCGTRRPEGCGWTGPLGLDAAGP